MRQLIEVAESALKTLSSVKAKRVPKVLRIVPREVVYELSGYGFTTSDALVSKRLPRLFRPISEKA